MSLRLERMIAMDATIRCGINIFCALAKIASNLFRLLQ
jgi:hypothetical protein